MARYSNPEIISDIQNGKEEVLFYVSQKFFQPARRWLRRKGVPDDKTPQIFISVLVTLFREIQQQHLSIHIDFESYLFNSLEEFFKQEKTKSKHSRYIQSTVYSDSQKEAVAKCVEIQDDDDRKILFSRYAEKLSFEQIAVRFNYSNPVIAEFEVNKAINRLDAIVRIRLNIEQN
ncbi:MAG: hypothetical protein KA444_03820 [Bacteroidia bacterium]|nr:hypothetical protein [Bacteroidia bacterium]